MTINTKATSIEKNGFVNFQLLGKSLLADLLNSGFELVFPNPTAGINSNTVKATLRPRVPDSNAFTVDPLANATSQTWHINVDCSALTSSTNLGSLRLCVTHPLQATDNGTVAEDAVLITGTGTGTSTSGTATFSRLSGEITSGWFAKDADLPEGGKATADGIVTIPFASGFWNGKTIGSATSGARTFSYRLTTANQGFALVVWEEGVDSQGSNFSWIVVQRPVSPIDGSILISGKCPVFCLYSVGGGEPDNVVSPLTTYDAADPYIRTHAQYDHNPAIYWYTVREVDVAKSSTSRLATVDSPDSRLVINAKQQIALAEGNRYVISYPNGFTTDRYMYKEEIDLLTYTSADVISQYSNVAVSVYGETSARQYKAMQANLPNNTGMRILILTSGPGF